MSPREAPTRTEALLAYAIAALTTLLWVACVLPAGALTGAAATGDDAVPLHRAALLLVPALLLLIATPVGCTLARRERGMRSLLATTDAFVALYVAIAIWTHGWVDSLTMTIAGIVLLVVGGLSIVETLRAMRSPDETLEPPRALAGARFAVCLLVLVVPLDILRDLEPGRASLLAPFLFIAVGAGGARLAKGMRGLHRTGALVQLLLAAHIVITLRYTIHVSHPTLERIFPAGRVTLGLALATLVAAALQLVVYLRPTAEPAPTAERADAPAA